MGSGKLLPRRRSVYYTVARGLVTGGWRPAPPRRRADIWQDDEGWAYKDMAHIEVSDPSEYEVDTGLLDMDGNPIKYTTGGMGPVGFFSHLRTEEEDIEYGSE